MAKYLNKFQDISEWKSSKKDLPYPWVSAFPNGKKNIVAYKENEEYKASLYKDGISFDYSDNDLFLTINVIDIDTVTKLFYNTSIINVCSKMFIDDNEIVPSTSYKFDTIGIHSAKLTFDTTLLTTIVESVFYCCMNLTYIILPDSVSTIKNYAFDGCKSLSFIEIGENITSIGESALNRTYFLPKKFVNKSSSVSSTNWGATLADIIQDDGLMIKDNAIVNLNISAETISMPTTITSINAHSCEYCSKLKEISISENTTIIGNYAFYYCSGLTSVTIPSGGTDIGQSAFAFCSSLSSVTIPETVTSIGSSTFYRCMLQKSNFVNKSSCISSTNWGATLVDIIQDDGLMIDNNTVVACKPSAQSVTIPTSVSAITKTAFSASTSLKEITYDDGFTTALPIYSLSVESIHMPNSITGISSSAFVGCTSLTSATIPSGVTSIGANAYSGCTSLTDLTYASGCTKTLRTYATAITSVTIPNSVTTISANAFNGCSGLTSVTIPSGVTSIEGSAFNGCTSLITISGGGQNCTLNTYAFNGCSSLEVIPIFRNCYSNAFSNCTSLKNVVFPNEYNQIYNNAFSGCTSLSSVTISSGTSLSSAYNYDYYYYQSPFYNCPNLKKVIYAEGRKSIPTIAARTITSVTIPNTAESIDTYAFAYYSGLTEINIPDSITSIGSYAFNSCSGLTEINIPDSLTSIQNATYANCSSLTSLDIPSGITSIYSDAFLGCSNLDTITVEEGNTSYNDGENSNCLIETSSNELLLGCKNTVIPSTVISVGNYAFDGCSELMSLSLPNSITSLGEYTFRNCSKLSSLTIQEGMTSIGGNTFYGCSGLTSLTLPSGFIFESKTESEWGGTIETFEGCTSLSSITHNTTVEDSKKIFTSYSIYNGKIVCLDGEYALYYALGTKSDGSQKYLSASDCSYYIPEGIVTIEFGVGVTMLYEFLAYSGLTTVIFDDEGFDYAPEYWQAQDLTTIIIKAATPPSCYGTLPSTLTGIFVPNNSVEAYKTATGWCDKADIIQGSFVVTNVKSLSITGDNAKWSATTANTHFVMLCDGTLYGETLTDYTYSGNTSSDSFEQNTSLTDSVTKTISTTMYETTATTTIIQGTKSDVDFGTEIIPVGNYNNLTITSVDNVRGNDTYANVHYTISYNYITATNSEVHENEIFSGTCKSSTFEQNTSTTETVEREINISINGMVVTTTITQGVYIPTDLFLGENTIDNSDTTKTQYTYQSRTGRLYSFIPSNSGTHTFTFDDDIEGGSAMDTYGYLFNEALTSCLAQNDDSGSGADPQFSYNCTANVKYYVLITPYTTSITTNVKGILTITN